MSGLALALRQIKFENRSFFRNPASAFFTLTFPIMFLVIFNLLFGNDTTERFGPPVSLSNFYVPAVAAYSVITACYTNIAIGVSFARDQGVLKRARGTPLPEWAFIFGKVGNAVLIGLLLVIIVTATGALFYGVEIPDNTMPAFLAALVVGAAAFCALGLAITAAVPNAEASPAVVNASILPLLFISDIFIPLDDAPGWLKTFSSLFPIKHYSDAMQTAFQPFTRGSGFEWGDLAVVAAWGLAGALLTARYFSWEPRR